MRRNTHLRGRPRRAQPDGQGRDSTPSPAGLNRITMHLLDGAGDVRSLSSTTCLKSVTLQGNIGRPEDQAWRYSFIARRSDHPPPHVHVYRNGRLIVKWDL